MTLPHLFLFLKVAMVLVLLTCGFSGINAQEIKEIQFCESIGDAEDIRNPVNSRFSFLEGDTIFCWIHATSQENIDTHIMVEWYNEDVFKSSYNLGLLFKSKKTSRYRTWASRSSYSAGNWRAEIKSSRDSLLSSAEFRVYEELKRFPGKQRLTPFSTSLN